MSTVRLTACDHCNPPVAAKLLAVYEVPPSPSPNLDAWLEHTGECLREAFVRVVSDHFRLLLGRLSFDEEDDATGERFFALLDVPTTDQDANARDVQQHITVSRSSWTPGRTDLANSNIWRWPIEALEAEFDPSHRPLVKARVTLCTSPDAKSESGSAERLSHCVAVSLCIHHSIGDAASLIQLFNCWADQARLGSVARPPCHERSLMYVPPGSKCAVDVTDENALPPFVRGFLPMDVDAPMSASEAMSKSFGCDSFLFRYSTSRLDEVRREVETATGVKVSKNDIVAGNLWWTAARATVAEDADEADDRPTVLNIPANIRNGRCQRPNVLPPEYFGNAVFGGAAIMPSAKSLASVPQAEAILAVHRGVRALVMNPDAIEAIIHWEGTRGADRTRRPGLVMADPFGMVLSSWLQYGLDTSDFGFGQPLLSVGLNRPGPFPLLGFVLPTPRAAADADAPFDVTIGLTPQLAESMINDPAFLGRHVGFHHRWSTPRS